MRIQQTFLKLKKQNKKALIPYIVAGDGGLDFSLSVMCALVESGADLIELGVPFSDPMADGVVIQRGHERALKNNTSICDVLDLVAKFRLLNKHTPIILMGYANPIESLGYEKFANLALVAGVDGVLVVDLPLEENKNLQKLLKDKIDLIYLIAPSTDSQRIIKISSSASGFIYFVSIKGVTGADIMDDVVIKNKISEIKKYSKLPIGIGFGIKNSKTAKSMAEYADAVIVGSSIVEVFGWGSRDEQLQKITKLVTDIKGVL
jgi:tryptophan synthase alpha chain